MCVCTLEPISLGFTCSLLIFRKIMMSTLYVRISVTESRDTCSKHLTCHVSFVQATLATKSGIIQGLYA